MVPHIVPIFPKLAWEAALRRNAEPADQELGIAAVPNGFRSSFRDWAAERTSTPREVVDTVQNPTEAAYARSASSVGAA